jgi:hypothetical protein
MNPPPRGSGQGNGALESRLLREEDFPQWQDLVDGSSSGSIYSYPDYLDSLCRVTGGDYRVLGTWSGDEIVGGIGLYEERSDGLRLCQNRYLLYYNGLVIRDFSSRYPSRNTARHCAVLASLEEALSNLGYDHVLLHSRHPVKDIRPFLSKGWTGSQTYSYLISLGDVRTTFHRIEPNQRRLIRRFQEAGGSFTEDRDFSSFYDLHVETAKRKGAAVYLPEAAFRKFFERISALGWCRLYQARLKSGQCVAAQLVLAGGHPVSHTVAAAADAAHLRLGATPFLRWKACEALALEGYEGNDLTDAALNEVTRFKRQLGGELVQNSVLANAGTVRYRRHRRGEWAIRRAKRAAGRVKQRVLGNPNH